MNRQAVKEAGRKTNRCLDEQLASLTDKRTRRQATRGTEKMMVGLMTTIPESMNFSNTGIMLCVCVYARACVCVCVTDRRTDRQTGRQAGRQAGRQTDRHGHRESACMCVGVVGEHLAV